ncbi:helix-turn-helix domain-containing protein [Ligilactobacillus cholophilus]|uniref:helix-turn-helix domain-containing protein n=1 Tax=Ligilactobacillus cholophilus TaxID=3050131 RepID=UPI0025B19972|nr:helix-turn-helix transcriptional regulator [Ligilactobacillus cholophilus]
MSETLGNRIALQRKKLGLSQKEITKKFNAYLENKTDLSPITQATFSRWETDASKPRASYLKNLANFFNVSVIYLANGEAPFTDIFDFINNVPNSSLSNLQTTEKQLQQKIKEIESARDNLIKQLNIIREQQMTSISQEQQNLIKIIKNDKLNLVDLLLLNSLANTFINLFKENDEIYTTLQTFLRVLLGYIMHEDNRNESDVKESFQKLLDLLNKEEK